MEAKLDGFRVYKIKSRDEETNVETPTGIKKKYTAPVYVIGLPGDVALLNTELDEMIDLPKLMGEEPVTYEDVGRMNDLGC